MNLDERNQVLLWDWFLQASEISGTTASKLKPESYLVKRCKSTKEQCLIHNKTKDDTYWGSIILLVYVRTFFCYFIRLYQKSFNIFIICEEQTLLNSIVKICFNMIWSPAKRPGLPLEESGCPEIIRNHNHVLLRAFSVIPLRRELSCSTS